MEVVEEYCNRGTAQEDNKTQTVSLKKDNVSPEEVVKIINNLREEPQQHHTTFVRLIWWKIDRTKIPSVGIYLQNSGGSDEAMEWEVISELAKNNADEWIEGKERLVHSMKNIR